MSESEKMRALVHLAGAISHELNNIFTAVTGNLSLVGEHIPQGTKPAEMIGQVVQTAQRGIALSQKLQAFAGRQKLNRDRVDIKNTILDVVNCMRATIPKTIGITLELSSSACISFIDGEKLRDVVEELVRNAVAAVGDEGLLRVVVQRKIVLATEELNLRTGVYARLLVIDNGPGMTPEVAGRAMDPMFSTKRSQVDSGWGLANCAGFVRQSGGTMSLQSQAAHGTTVEIYLPVESEPLNA